ncbi:MAG TPA: hypothetical protein VFV40_06735 [Nocardioides sp.]|nr:hypothetical protein [Nocardioides sp.]
MATTVASGLDEERADHTRPTIAYIVLAIAAAAVMTAGLAGPGAETPIAADRPPRVVGPATQPAMPTEEPDVLQEFSMADVVTLAAVQTPARPARTRAPGTAPVATAGTTAPDPGSRVTVGSAARTGSRAGAGAASPRTSPDRTSGSQGAGRSGGPETREPAGAADAGPGRSTTGQGRARGQRDSSPGRDSTRTSAPGKGRR